MTLRAIPNADRTLILLRKGNWRSQWPMDRIDDLIDLYRGLAERQKGRFAAFYRDDIVTLEQLAKRVKA